MQWYNKATKELQSNPPFLGWLHPDVITERFPDWEQVSDNFIPVPAVVVNDNDAKIKEINDKYDTLFAENNLTYVTALRNNDAKLMTELNTERDKLQSDYRVKMEAINNG